MRTFHTNGKAKQFTDSIYLALIPRNPERAPKEMTKLSIYEHTTKKYDLQSDNRTNQDAPGDSR